VEGLALGSTQDDWSADFSPITTSMIGTIWALIVYAVFGVLVMSREYAGGLIRLTLSATPRRGRVLAAEMLLVAGITLLFGLLPTVGMFLVGQVVLGLGAVMSFFPIAGPVDAVLSMVTVFGGFALDGLVEVLMHTTIL
jgi:ABC-2 type transport system permease protein